MKNIHIVEEINQGNQDVYLRKISLDDADFFFKSLREEVISRYLSLGPLVSHSYSKKLLKKYQKFWEEKVQFNYVIEIRGKNSDKKNFKKVGAISLWRISWLHNRAEIGIWITPKYWNMGLAKKALNLIKIIGFVHLNLNRLEAHIAVENKRSINLFKSKEVAFFDEGTLKQYLNLGGIYHDAVALSYLKENWNKSNRFPNE